MIRRSHLPPPPPAPIEKLAEAAPGAVPEEVARVRACPPGQGRIVVVGAGASGLCAAVELEALGYEVTVLEAEADHIGGRIRTAAFGPGHGELGAMRIPAVHDLTRFYAAECELALRPFVQSNDEAFLHIRGTRVRARDAGTVKKLFALTPSEAELGDLGLWKKAMIDLADSLTPAEAADLLRPRPVEPRVLEFDRQSLYGRLRAVGLSVEAIQLIASLWSLETSLHIGLLEHLREEADGVWARNFDEIVGGMSRLPHALAARLRSGVRAGCPVVAVRQEAAEVTAVCADGREVRGDWLVCTVPLGAMKRIIFDPPLSAHKRDAIRRVNYDSSTKVLALARRRFWEMDDGIYGGGSISDGPLGSTWYPSDNAEARDPSVSAAPAVFLASYSWGLMARRMAGSSRGEIVGELAKLHDSVRDDPELIEDVLVWSWDEYGWTEGAYAFALPGEQTELQESVVAPEGRLVFAGEHASSTHSWIQGALRSGLAAAEHIARPRANG